MTLPPNIRRYDSEGNSCKKSKNLIAVPYLTGDVRVMPHLRANKGFCELYLHHQNEIRSLLSSLLEEFPDSALLVDSIGSNNEATTEGFILTENDIDKIHEFEQHFPIEDHCCPIKVAPSG